MRRLAGASREASATAGPGYNGWQRPDQRAKLILLVCTMPPEINW